MYYYRHFPTSYFSRGYEGIYSDAQSSRLKRQSPRNEDGSFECESELGIYENRLKYTKPRDINTNRVVTALLHAAGGWGKWIESICIVDFYRYLYRGLTNSVYTLKWRANISKIISPFPYDSLKEGPYFAK